MENRGQSIPGSCLVRDFCLECGEPMRVTEDHIKSHRDTYCERCQPHKAHPKAESLTARQCFKMK